MYLTSKQMAQACKMSRQGFHKLARNLKLPHIRQNNRFLYNLNSLQFQDFFESVQLSLAHEGQQVFYSLRDLSKLRHKHKDTIKQLLIEHDVKLYRTGRKILVLLIDLYRLKQQPPPNYY